jgi:MFS family permease
MVLRGRYLHWAVTAASCQAFLLLGYDQGVMSGLIGANNQFGQTFNNPDSTMQGLLTSIYDIGCAVGCLLSLVIGHKFGRRQMIIAGGSIMIIGTIILGSSYTVPQFLVGRIVTGIGNGINSSTVPAYQSELARPEQRGMLLSAQGTVTILGLCIAYWLDYGLSFVDTPVQWRFPISFQAFFAIFLVLQMIPLPDSPRWLCEQDRSDEAASVLARLQLDQPANESSPEVVHLRHQIESSIEIESAGGPFKYKELWSGGQMGNLRRMILAAVVNIQQQFTGGQRHLGLCRIDVLTYLRLKHDKLLCPYCLPGMFICPSLARQIS